MPVDSTRPSGSSELQREKLRSEVSSKDPNKPVRRALTRKVAFERERPHHSLIPDVGALDREVARQRDIYEHRPLFTGLDGAVLKFPRPDRELTQEEKLARARWLLEPMGLGDPDHPSPEGARVTAELARIGGVDTSRSLRNYLPTLHVATELSRRSLELREAVGRFLAGKTGDFPPELQAAVREAAAVPEVESEEPLVAPGQATDHGALRAAIGEFKEGRGDPARLVFSDDEMRDVSRYHFENLQEGLWRSGQPNSPDAVRAALRLLARAKTDGADLSSLDHAALRRLDPNKTLSPDAATLATVRRLAKAFGWSEKQVQFQNRRLSDFGIDPDVGEASPASAESSPGLALEPRRANWRLPCGQLGVCGESLSANYRNAHALAEHGVSSYMDSTVKGYPWTRERLRPLVDVNPDMVSFYARLAEIKPEDHDVRDSIQRFFGSPLRDDDIAGERLANVVRLALAAQVPLRSVQYVDPAGIVRSIVEHPEFAALEDPEAQSRSSAAVAAELQTLDPQRNQPPAARQRALQALVRDREDAPEFWELFPALVEARAAGRLAPVAFSPLEGRRFLEQAARAFGTPEAAVLIAAVSTPLTGAEFAQFLVERGLPRAYAKPLGMAAGRLAGVDGETLKHLLADVLRHPRAPDVTTLPTRAELLSGGVESATVRLPQAAPVDPSGFARAVLEHAIRLPVDSAEREALIALVEGAVRDGSLHRGAVVANLPAEVQHALADRPGALPDAAMDAFERASEAEKPLAAQRLVDALHRLTGLAAPTALAEVMLERSYQAERRRVMPLAEAAEALRAGAKRTP